MTIKHKGLEVLSPKAKPYGAYTGQTLVEWCLLLALISLTCIASLSQVGAGINTALATVNDGLMSNNGMNNLGGYGNGGSGNDTPPPINPNNGNPQNPNGDTGQQSGNMGAPLNYPE